MSRTLRVLLAIGALLAIAVAAMSYVAIWTGDNRWSDTAFATFMVGVAVGGAALVQCVREYDL